MNKLPLIFLLAVMLIPSSVLAQDPPTEVWVRTFDLGSDDWGEDIAVDAAGFVYVTGNTYNGADYDWLTIKYDANGDTAWARVYDSGSGEDIANAVAVDNTGNVYVVGWTPDSAIHDWRMIKYDANGTILWNKIRDWGADVDQGCHDIVVDTAGGYVYMIGDFIGATTTWDYLTVKCDLDGNNLGENGWSGGTGVDNNGWPIALDDSGNVYVSGVVWNATKDWGTVRYDPNLSLDWTDTYDSGADENTNPGSITVDHTGCVYLVGWVENVTTDWQIVKYDQNGVFAWDMIVDTLGNDEGAWGVEADAAGDIYINGDFDTGTGWDCRTIKCDSDGNMLWDVTYDGGSSYNDAGRGLAIDDSGYVYVVGHSYNGTTVDYLVIKYTQQTGVEERHSTGRSTSLALKVVNNPSAVPVLKCAVPAGAQANLGFYSLDGRKLQEFTVSSGNSTFTWNAGDLPSGVYFGRLAFGSRSTSAKICLAK